MAIKSQRDTVRHTRLKEATKTLSRLSTKYSIDLPADYYVAVARTFVAEHNLEEARKNLRQAIRIDGANPKAWWELVSSYLDEHRYSKALEKVRNALGRLPRNPDLRILKGIALSELHRYGDALHQFDHASVKQSKSVEIQYLRHRNRATTLYRQAKMAEALLELERAYKLEHDPEILAAIAEGYVQLDRFDLALRYAKRAVAGDSTDVAGWATIGVCETVRSNFRAAIKAFEKARSLEPTNVEILANLAHALDHGREYNRAVQISRKLKKLDKKKDDGYYWESRGLWLTGKRDEAVRVVAEGLRKAKAKTKLKRLKRSMERGIVPEFPPSSKL